MNVSTRNGQGFVAGSLIGTLGGLTGLGGAEFRLPLRVGVFRLDSLEAIILNKAMSLVVVAAALLYRSGTIAPDTLLSHFDVVPNLLAGTLVGAWWAAGHAVTLPRQGLNRIVLVLLVGGELLIPTVMLLYGPDIKLAGSLSLMVSLPTMLIGFARYTRADAFHGLRKEKPLRGWMVAGSILGAAVGGLLLGLVSSRWLMGLLGVVLLVSAIKTFDTHVDGESPC